MASVDHTPVYARFWTASDNDTMYSIFKNSQVLTDAQLLRDALYTLRPPNLSRIE